MCIEEYYNRMCVSIICSNSHWDELFLNFIIMSAFHYHEKIIVIDKIDSTRLAGVDFRSA